MQALSTRLRGVLAALALLVTMFAPMVAIYWYGASGSVSEKVAAGEVTVGIAVIMRATARRLLRGASSNLMRTTAGALGRTSARALTRRLVKFMGRLFFGSVVQQSSADAAAVQAGADPDDPADHHSALSQAVALALGFVALCVSFRGVLYIAGSSVVEDLLGASGLGMLEVTVLSGVPLLAYAVFHQVFGRLFDVRATYRTEIDGLLLQAYFTGAGSFLPLTTDVDYAGTERGKRNVATGSILGLFFVHFAFVLTGNWIGSEQLVFLGSMFLIYCFVYCFPIRPLEGHFIWSSSKLLWLCVTLPILVAFLSWLPPVFGEIL